MKHHPFRPRNPLNMTKVNVAEHNIGVTKLKVGGAASPATPRWTKICPDEKMSWNPFTWTHEWVDYEVEVVQVELDQILQLKAGCSEFSPVRD